MGSAVVARSSVMRGWGNSPPTLALGRVLQRGQAGSGVLMLFHSMEIRVLL